MKIIKETLFISTFFSVILLFAACTKSDTIDRDIIYEGHIYNDSSGSPAPGIRITLLGCKSMSGDQKEHCNCHTFDIGESTSDSLGHFYIKGKEARTDSYKIVFPDFQIPSVHLFCLDKETLLSHYSSFYIH